MKLNLPPHHRRAQRTLFVALGCTIGLALGLPASALASVPTASTRLVHCPPASPRRPSKLSSTRTDRRRYYHVDYGLASSEWCTSNGASGSPEYETASNRRPPGHGVFISPVN